MRVIKCPLSNDTLVFANESNASKLGYVVYQHYSCHYQPFTRDHKTLRPTDTVDEAVDSITAWAVRNDLID